MARPGVMVLEDRRLLSTFTVDSTANNTNVGTLPWAIEQANTTAGANTINFDGTVFSTPRTITLHGSQLELSNTGGTQTITGPAAGVTINGGGLSRVFQVDNGVTASLSGLTVTGGNAGGGSGGALYNNGGTVTLADCTISGNSAESGGGACNNSSSTLTVTDTTFTDNVAGSAGGSNGRGGGIYSGGTLDVDDGTFSGNKADFGGGVYSQIELSLRDSAFSNNTAAGTSSSPGLGGGLCYSSSNSSGSASVTNCSFSGNSSAYGGGIFVGQGSLTLSDSSVTGNMASQAGGGIENFTTLTVLDSTLAGNTATDGGGLDNDLGMSTLTDTTIAGNSASDAGGGIDNETGATLDAVAVTIADNNVADGGTGGGLYAGATSTPSLVDSIVAMNTIGTSASDVSGTVTGSNDLVGIGGSGGLANGVDDNIVLTSLSAVGLTPLGSYGGPTETMALLPGSAAIGQGGTVNGVTEDQRGLSPDSPDPDIGAFQSQGYTLSVVGGSGQAARVGAVFADPLTAVIEANNPDEPVTGGTVSFASVANSDGATATLSGSTVSIGAGGTASVTATANSSIGSYTVVASIPGAAAADFNLKNQTTPGVSVTDAGGIYNGSPFPGTATVAGVDGVFRSSLEGVTPTLAYYAGPTATGSPLAGAPSGLGTYTVVAEFPGSSDYIASQSTPVTFTIARRPPTVTVTDAGGTYNGSAFPATATVAGVDGTASSSLENVSPTLAYYAGPTATGSPLAGAPSSAGSYTVVATFAGSTDYSSGTAQANFTITPATPALSVAAPGGVFSGDPLPASATIAGIDGTPGSSLEGVAPTLAYYAGPTATGSPLAGAPSSAGSYTVVATFAGSTDYAPQSRTVGLIITEGTSTLTMTATAGSAVSGQAVSFVATVSAPGGAPTGTVTFSDGGTVVGTASLDGSGRATLTASTLGVGTHSITASYGGDGDVGRATSSPSTIAVAKASSQVAVEPLATYKKKKIVSLGLEVKIEPVGPGAGVPTGAVEFVLSKTKKKTKVLGTESLSGGMATLPVKPSTVLKKSIMIIYAGDGDFQASQRTVTITKNSIIRTAQPMEGFRASGR